MTDLPVRDKLGGGGQAKGRERREAGRGDRGAAGGGGSARVGRNFVSTGGEKGEDEGNCDGGRKMKKGDGFGMQDDRRRRRSKVQERKRKGAMGIMGDNGDGYQLAVRLENSGIWREWLGPGWYSKIVPHLASSATWRNFMMNTSATPLGFQMRVRALLFDKAASCLACAESDDEAVDLAISPTTVAPSFLQLHADGIYCSLEQDAEDWKRLQTEGSPISSLVGKDRNSVDSAIGIKQETSDARGQPVNFAQQRQPPRPVQNLPNLVSPKQEGSRPSLSKVKKVEAWDNVDAKRSIEGVGTISKKLRSPKISSKPPALQGDSAVNRDQSIDKVAIAKSPQSCVSTSDDPRHSATGGVRAISTETAESLGLWYDKCMDKAVGDRMRRVAHRSSQQNLPFEKREAVVRTAEGMAAYIEQFSDRKVKISPARALDATAPEPKAASLKVKTEASVESRTDASVSQDFKFLANSVPDNPVSAPKRRRHSNNQTTCSGLLDKLDLPIPSACRGVDGGSGRPQGQRDIDSAVNLDSDISRSSRSAGHSSPISEQMSQVLTQKVVAKLVSGAGFEGLKQSSMDFMCDLLDRHLWKMGSALRTLADNYSKPGSQTELLRLFIQSTGGSVEDLVQHVKAGSSAALPMGTPVAGQTGTAAASLGAPNLPTQKRRQAPAHQAQQGLVSPQALDNPVRQQPGHQPVSEKASKRRQSSNLGRNKRADKDKSGNEGKSAAEQSDLSRMAGRDLMPMQTSPRLNPQPSTWHPQPPLIQSPRGSVMPYK